MYYTTLANYHLQFACNQENNIIDYLYLVSLFTPICPKYDMIFNVLIFAFRSFLVYFALFQQSSVLGHKSNETFGQ